jgi:twitching motility two-component system response regulator PilG
MLRPLIATRVLAILDDYFAQQHADAVQDAPTHDVAIVSDGDTDDEAETPRIARDIAAIDDALLNEDIVVPPPRAAATPAVARKRALVVDDSPAVRKQLEIELIHFDVEVDFAASARQALSMLEATDYDVVFLDVVLPDMDGYQICKRIKTTSRRTRVVMLTGKATTEDKLKGTLAGCDAYLVKPVGRLTFQSTVKSYLPLSVGAQSLKL